MSLRVNAGNVNHCEFYHVRISSLGVFLTLLAPAWESPIGLLPAAISRSATTMSRLSDWMQGFAPIRSCRLVLRRAGRDQNDSKPYRDNLQRLFLP